MTVFPDQAAHDYDDRILRLVPGYALALDLMACLLATRVSGSSHILVPGCGTGSEVLALARQLPEARFTALEPSAGMLDVARRKLTEAGFADRVTFVCGKLEDVPEEQYDAATLALVLHFISDDGAKAAFLAGISRRLVVDAPFLLIDAVSEPFADEALVFWLRQQGHAAAAADAVLSRMKAQWHRVTAQRMATLLTDAGLAESQPFFHAIGYRGTICARRPTS